MKALLLILAVTFFSCGGNTNNTPVIDSANAIEDHPLEDTQVGPNPNGYAPPNTSTDISQRLKDSLDTSRH